MFEHEERLGSGDSFRQFLYIAELFKNHNGAKQIISFGQHRLSRVIKVNVVWQRRLSTLPLIWMNRDVIEIQRQSMQHRNRLSIQFLGF